MQKTLIIITLLLTAFGAKAQSEKGRGITIQDARKQKGQPQADVAKHKYHDVEIYRILLGKEEGYKIIYYVTEYDLLKDYAFMVGDDEAAFDKATYSWSDDTVHVYFMNSKTKKEMTYGGYGHNGTSSLFFD